MSQYEPTLREIAEQGPEATIRAGVSLLAGTAAVGQMIGLPDAPTFSQTVAQSFVAIGTRDDVPMAPTLTITGIQALVESMAVAAIAIHATSCDGSGDCAFPETPADLLRWIAERMDEAVSPDEAREALETMRQGIAALKETPELVTPEQAAELERLLSFGDPDDDGDPDAPPLTP